MGKEELYSLYNLDTLGIRTDIAKLEEGFVPKGFHVDLVQVVLDKAIYKKVYYIVNKEGSSIRIIPKDGSFIKDGYEIFKNSTMIRYSKKGEVLHKYKINKGDSIVKDTGHIYRNCNKYGCPDKIANNLNVPERAIMWYVLKDGIYSVYLNCKYWQLHYLEKAEEGYVI